MNSKKYTILFNFVLVLLILTASVNASHLGAKDWFYYLGKKAMECGSFSQEYIELGDFNPIIKGTVNVFEIKREYMYTGQNIRLVYLDGFPPGKPDGKINEGDIIALVVEPYLEPKLQERGVLIIISIYPYSSLQARWESKENIFHNVGYSHPQAENLAVLTAIKLKRALYKTC